MEPKEYVEQFHVVGEKSDLNCDMLSRMLYSALVNKFRVTMVKEEYVHFKEYQERMYDLVENLRELDIDTIKKVLDYLQKINHYIPDLIIMMWSLPRIDDYLSKLMYQNKYRNNIRQYNPKLQELLEHQSIKNFCIETLTKTNNIPVHCIDIMWYFINDLSFEFSFINYENGMYINFAIPHDRDVDDFIKLSFNMQYLLDMGLGRVVCPAKGSFRNFLKKFVTDPQLVKHIAVSESGANYKKQIKNIIQDTEKYFGEKMEINEEIKTLLGIN